MPVPAGLLGFNGEVVKGEICLRDGDNKSLLEYGVEQVGNRITCYALATEEDIIIPYISVTSGTEEFVDIVADGILRASHSNDKGTKKTTKNFDWVCGHIKQGNRYVNKAFQMQVTKRNIDKSRHYIDGTPSSAVGSVEFQIFRRDPEAKKSRKHRGSSSDTDNGDETSSSSSEESTDTESLGDAKRAPTYEEYTDWWKLNSLVGETGKPSPPFEVGLVNQKNVTPTAKARVLKKWPGEFKLWASFRFILLSPIELQKVGFDTCKSSHDTHRNGAQSSSENSGIVKGGSSTTKEWINDSDHEDNQSLVVSASEDDAVGSKTGKAKAKEIAGHGLQVTSDDLENQPLRAGPSWSQLKVDPLTKENLQIFDSSDEEMGHEGAEAKATATAVVTVRESHEVSVTSAQGPNAGDTVPEFPQNELLSKTTKAKSAQELSSGDTGIFAHLERKGKPTSVSEILSGPANKPSTDQNRGELPSSHPGTGAPLKLMTTGLQENQDSPSSSKAKPGFDGAEVSKGEEPLEERRAAPEFELLSPQWEPLTPPQTAKLQGLQKFNTFTQHNQHPGYGTLNNTDNPVARPDMIRDSRPAENKLGVNYYIQNPSLGGNLLVANQHPMNIQNALFIQKPMDVKSRNFIKDLDADDEQMVDAPILPSTSVMNMETDKPMSSSESTNQKVPVGFNASPRSSILRLEANVVAEVMDHTISTRTPLPSSKKTATPPKPVKKEGKTPTPAKNSAMKANKASSTLPSNTEAESAQAKPKKAAAPKTTKTPKAAKAVTGTDAEPSASAAKPKPKGKGKGKTEGSPTAAGKRKADQMTPGSSEAGPSKTNQSPASKQIALVERETAAAEARIQAAAEKRKLLEQHLQAMKEAKVQREKAQEINDRAKALEDENAALEAEILRLAAQCSGDEPA
ncbi:hypothetical protein CJF31_00000473 [Rutstroemia sp. NJR-2017a BVV2]|nr:hypothetical protein CJF31_00000473 [Rutstroemia sp. NJR-2017a BVV2]